MYSEFNYANENPCTYNNVCTKIEILFFLHFLLNEYFLIISINTRVLQTYFYYNYY